MTGAVATQTPRGSGAPDATGVHRPAEAARLQLLQGPRHALSQQTPSVHQPVAHSSLPAQGCPGCLPPLGQLQDGSGSGTGLQRPPVPGRLQELHGPWQAIAQQTPCAQKPLAQMSLPVQGVMQWLPLHL